MFRNYLKIAFRQLWRNKAFSIINITGLAVGLAACLLLFVVVRYELSYDQFLPGNDRVFGIVTQNKNAEYTSHTAGVPEPALHDLRMKFPDITIGSLYSSNGSQVTILGENANESVGDKYIENSGIFFADPEWFEVFPYDWTLGTKDVLKEPGTVVLTQDMANKYFGDWKRATGQHLKLDNVIPLRVAGILQNIPANTEIPIAMVVSMETARSNKEIYNYIGDKGTTTSNFRLYARLSRNKNRSCIQFRAGGFFKRILSAPA
ncbi:MAG: ABC transporter permease [Chitinophagaceae bacterium]|nr:ABC transporter permease [Chitinophagaceae bacterium]